MGLHLSRTLRSLFVRARPGPPTETAFDTEAAIARYLVQRERRSAEPIGRETY